MSQKQDKKMRRMVRKFGAGAYEQMFVRQGERDAKMMIIAKAVKPKPKLMPRFLWIRIVNRVLRSPDEIAFKKP